MIFGAKATRPGEEIRDLIEIDNDYAGITNRSVSVVVNLLDAESS